MTEAAIDVVVKNMKELVDHHSRLIGDNSGHMVRLQRDLLEFKAFLKDSVGKDDESTKVMVDEIHQAFYEVEDMIDIFVYKTVAKINRGISSLPKFLKIPLDLHTVSKKVEVLRKRVQHARDDLKSHQSQQSQLRPPRKKHVVGFEDEADDLINRLTRDSNRFEVISLVGMPGAGKTSLAWKVFNDRKIGWEFPVRIWLSISQEFSDRDIFLSILKYFTTIGEEMESKSDHEIADLVIAHLDEVSFLIVMDDVCETAHWRRLYAALLNHNKGKVLITSCNGQVANFASRTESIKKLRSLNDQESWELLRLEVLHTLDCPPELENVGRLIARNCKGLPLSVVIIGGVLAAMFNDSDIRATERIWNEVCTRMNVYLYENDLKKGHIRKILSLLPYHLRSCFLYLGVFDEDYKIPVSKLIQLWIGEGFIPHSESCSLEETAEQYLEELIKRNLVNSEKLQCDGKVKTCRIHPTLSNFCKAEAENENLGKQIKYSSRGFSPPMSDIDKYRRLSINSNCVSFISSKPKCPHAHSFVSFSKERYVVSKRNSSKFFAAFKFLKVLDVGALEFEEIDTNIYQLVYLRYLVLSSNLSVLRSEFSQLWNIQTLIIHTKSRTLEVKADIWKMNKLRYFKTNASAILPKPSQISKCGKQLQRLGIISVESCTPELFNRATNLKRLGIRGNLNLLFDASSGSFDSLGKMEDIEKLKLINDGHPFPSSARPLRGLPRHHQFPSGLMRLTLRATFLSWDAMSTLALLKKLEVLKLKEKAFMGTTWNGNAGNGGFECLQLLHIEDTDLIIWEASSLCYPKLTSLVLRNCEKLQAIPNGIAGIPSLQTLELYRCRSAAASAKAIKEAKIKTQPQGSAFMLSIYPPTEY